MSPCDGSIWSMRIRVCFLKSGLAPSFMTKFLTRRKMSQYRKINTIKINGRKTVFTMLNIILFWTSQRQLLAESEI